MHKLGTRWEYPTTSFKPYPCGSWFFDCVTQLYMGEGLRAGQVKSMVCPIAEWMIPIMCEPREIKLRPATEYHAKFSLPFTIAATLTFGRLGVEAFSNENINNPDLLALMEKIVHAVDPTAIDSRGFKGWVKVKTNDGRHLERVVMDNWGSECNPMTPDQVRQKFRENAALKLDGVRVEKLLDYVGRIKTIMDVGEIVAGGVNE
jgi:2-methylcitrate dehydratase PrpD